MARPAPGSPYRRFLAGLDYVLNGQGIAPHPNLTRWVEEQIEAWIKAQLAADARIRRAESEGSKVTTNRSSRAAERARPP